MPDREDRDNEQPQASEATAAPAPPAPAENHGERSVAESRDAAPAAMPATRRPPAAREGRGDDVAIDAAHLKLDEVSLEVQANVGLERLNVEAKGLDAELYVRANLDNVVALVDIAGSRTPRIIEGVARTATGRGSQGQQAQVGHGGSGLGEELESALEGARKAYERVTGGELRDELQDAYQTVRSAYERVLGDPSEQEHHGDEGDASDRGDDASERHDRSSSSSPADAARRFARSPGGAATAAVAGAAAGALANAKAGSHDGLRSMLPGHRRSVVSELADRATDVPGEVATAVRRRLR